MSLAARNIVPFVPKSEKQSREALNNFICWAKEQAHCYSLPSDPIIWESDSWVKWGIRNSRVSKLGNKDEILSSDFVDFAKAYILRAASTQSMTGTAHLIALRCLEAASIEILKCADITLVNAAVFDKACVLLGQKFRNTTPYKVSRQIKKIHRFIHDSGIVHVRFTSEPQIKEKSLTLKDSRIESERKLPSNEVLLALGEMFVNQPELPDDILVTSSVAIMLSHPCRIGELNYLSKDCLYTEKDESGRNQLYMLWYSEKGFGHNKKIVPDSMAGICREAVNRLKDLTEEGRNYAKWLEENPESFPPHDNVPIKNLDESLSLEEVCEALQLKRTKESPARSVVLRYLRACQRSQYSRGKVKELAGSILSGFDSRGRRVFDGSGKLKCYEFEDTFKITLRDLNVLVREKYLPRCFPFTDENKIVKYQDSLFCFKNGVFGTNNLVREKPFGIYKKPIARRSALLGGGGDTTSIFERHGYSGVKVNSHAFRHWLNTGAQRANLSQELIARWSGRVDIGQNRVYNHIPPSEKADQLAKLEPHSGEVGNDLLSLLKTNKPITMVDLKLDGPRVIHRTEFGVCIHDYSEEPCAKFNNCLTCGEHVCVKGDEVKLANLKEEREYLRKGLESFRKEVGSGTYGANTWFQTTMEKLERCDQLIRMLEDPDVDEGALIWGRGNGWTAGRNALAVRGELIVEDSNLIASDVDKNVASELEKLLEEN